jgi:hypothetical protein
LLASTALGSVLSAVLSAILAAAAVTAAAAQTVGPGTITSTVTVRNGTTTVVGTTTLMPRAGVEAAHVTGGGDLVLDAAAVPSPGPINVTTTNATAILVQGGGSVVINPDQYGVFITTTNGVGILAKGNGGLTINPGSGGTSITTTGPDAHAIVFASSNLSGSLADLTIATSGPGAHGIKLGNPNTRIDGTAVTISTSGAGASALAMGGSNGGTRTANFTNSNLQSTGGPTIIAGGNTANILLDSSTLTGTVLTEAKSTSNVTLRNNTTWDMTGDSNITNLTVATSTIQFFEPAGSVFKTLTTHNYLGMGATIGLNTLLGSDGLPLRQAGH